jgi:HEPN superfamily Swt1-like protein
MKADATAALFVALAQTAEKSLSSIEEIVPKEALLLSPEYDLAELIPEKVKNAVNASEGYKLFFVFESYLREFIVEVLSKGEAGKTWWDFAPSDVKDEVSKLEQTEEVKSWMALGSRDKSALLTLPQLLKVIEHCWKEGFSDIVRDKSLIHEARMIGHLRNTICHMSTISDEETDRIKQTMRDWFRVVAP